MHVELIPVIEIGYSNQGVPVPDKWPFWQNSGLWDSYYAACYLRAGFADKLPPYLPGASFYRLTDISESNLLKLVKDHTEEMRNGVYSREQACAFFGGYILRIDGQDKYFPQCCGDLSDIHYWKNLLTENKSTYYQGHPVPVVKITPDKVIFDFSVDEFDEPFIPPPPDTLLEVDKMALGLAIENVTAQLKMFGTRLLAINIQQQLNIDAIDNLLIWGDD